MNMTEQYKDRIRNYKHEIELNGKVKDIEIKLKETEEVLSRLVAQRTKRESLGSLFFFLFKQCL